MLRTSMPLVALGTALLVAAAPTHADEAGMRQELAAMRTELAALKAEVNQLRAATSAANPSSPAIAAAQPSASIAPATLATPVTADASVAAAPSSSPVAPTGIGVSESTRLWGYGELNYNRPTANASAAKADVRRAVLGFSHAFDDSTHVYGELEWEHAIASASDSGEAAVEQLYVEHQVVPAVAVRAGLSLIPLGFINERHEPTNYYGVERNFVETAIIPSTWREGGVSLLGSTDSGLSWNVGLTTGFDLSKWDATANEGRESPLGSIHQELAQAKARDVVHVRGGELAGHSRLHGRWRRIHRRRRPRPAGFSREERAPDLGRGARALAAGSIRSVRALCARTDQRHRGVEPELHRQPDTGAEIVLGRLRAGRVARLAARAIRRSRRSCATRRSTPRRRMRRSRRASACRPRTPSASGRVGAELLSDSIVVFKADYQHFNLADEVLGYANRFNLGVGYQF